MKIHCNFIIRWRKWGCTLVYIDCPHVSLFLTLIVFFSLSLTLSNRLFVSLSEHGAQDAESGARLTCHLLLRLFKTSHHPGFHSLNGRNGCGVKASCDRHLLAATHDSLMVAPVLGVLKGMLYLSKL